MNKKAIGEISTAKILARLLEKSSHVAIPFGDNLRYDLVVVDGSVAIRIQCKTAYKINDNKFRFATCNHNPFSHDRRGYRGEADFFFVYYPENDKIYKLKVDEVSDRGDCTLHLGPSKSGQILGVRLAKDYEF